MQFAVRSFLFAALATVSAPVSAAELTEAWRTPGFDLPESVSWDAKSNAFYISNLGTDPTSKDGNGFIAKLTPDGRIETLKWAVGLNAPKGTEIVGDKLFVSDIDELVAIDLASGKVLDRYPAPGAKFLNDLAVAADGRIFVSDTATNSIYLFEKGTVTEWLKDDAIPGPNGLTIVGTDLVVALLGDISRGFANMQPVGVKKIDLVSRAVADFGTADPIGNLDGIEPDGEGGVFVSANPQGLLLDVKPGQKAVEIGRLAPGAADFEYVADRKLFVIPQMGQSEIVAYTYAP